MIPTSEAFSEAIKTDNRQMPLFIFNNAIMTAEDIDISSGILFSENVMSDEDFAPGACCSSTIDFNLLNDSGAWTAFGYGEFKALLGVCTNEAQAISDCYCRIELDGATICGYEEAPYLTFNGSAVAGVGKSVVALFLYNEKLFVFTDDGYVGFTYNGSALKRTTFDFYDAPLIQASKRWGDIGIGIVYGHKIAGITTGLEAENCFTMFLPNEIASYEMIPLGVFEAKKPVYSSKKTISIECYDRLVSFDADYDSSKFQYPTTLYGLLQQVCTAAGITLKNQSIDNGDVPIATEPDFEGNTLRDILGFIAEISGDFAKMTRDGELELRWFQAVSAYIDPYQYAECNIGYYNAAGVDKLVIRDIASSDVNIGEGENAWYIQQNPIARVLIAGGE